MTLFLTRSPAGPLPNERKQQCSRCRSWCSTEDFGTPRGGRYEFQVLSTHGTAETHLGSYTLELPDEAANGCWFCGSPDWDGFAQPGPLSRGFHW